MKTTLFNIEAQYLALMNEIEQADGEITPEVDKALTINKADLVIKSVNYIEFINSNQAFKGRIDAEIKRLQAYKKTTISRIDYLKTKLVDAVGLFGNYDADLHRVGTRKSTVVDVFDPDVLPKEYKVQKVTTEPNKGAIKDAISNGENVPGAVLVSKLNLKLS